MSSFIEADAAYEQAAADFEAAEQQQALADERMGEAEAVLLHGRIRTVMDAAIKARHLARLARSDLSSITVESLESLADGLTIFAKMPRARSLQIPLNP